MIFNHCKYTRLAYRYIERYFTSVHASYGAIPSSLPSTASMMLRNRKDISNMSDIYVDPTTAEYKNLLNSTRYSRLRGIINVNSARLYIFNAETLHAEVLHLVGSEKNNCIGITIEPGRKLIGLSDFNIADSHTRGKYTIDEAKHAILLNRDLKVIMPHFDIKLNFTTNRPN